MKTYLSLRACLKIARGPAARDFGGGQGGEAGVCRPNARWLLLAALVCAGVGTGLAQSPPPAASASQPAGTNAPVRQLSADVFQVGLVRLDKQARTVTFPAALNLNKDLIEYLVVTTTGKTHESLLRTDADPAHLKVALLLLGVKDAPGGWFPEPPSEGPIVGQKRGAGGAPAGRTNAPAIPGGPVEIAIRWQAGAQPKQLPIESLVRDLRTGKPMARGPFVFNGSRVWNGVFVAQREGSIVSLITDPDALINNPRPGRELDDVWEVLPAELPPLGTPVEVILSLPAKARPSAPKPKSPPTL